MDAHPILRHTDELQRRTGMSQADAHGFVRRVFDDGVEEGTRRMLTDLAAAHREIEELRRRLEGG